MRRQALALEARPDLQVVELRGNVDTRLATVARGEIDAAVLAAAGLERLEAQTEAGPLDTNRGGCQHRAREPSPSRARPAGLSSPRFWPLSATLARRQSSSASGPSRRDWKAAARCLSAASLLRRDSSLVVTGFLGAPDGSQGLRDRISGPVSDASAMGIELAEAILASGGKDILDDVHAEVGPS